MKGTEKQIIWAKDIQTAVITTIDTMLESIKGTPAENGEMAEKFRRARAAVQACEIAMDMIEVYKGASTAKTPKENAGVITPIIRNRFRVQYDNVAQQALIGE